METKNNYYADQLKKVDLTTGFPANVKITNCDTSTKTLSLNDESATALVKWLKENYNITDNKSQLTLSGIDYTTINEQRHNLLDVMSVLLDRDSEQYKALESIEILLTNIVLQLPKP